MAAINPHRPNLCVFTFDIIPLPLKRFRISCSEAAPSSPLAKGGFRGVVRYTVT